MHLSDFHCQRFTERERKLIKIISEEKPDFIFFTGDFVEKEKWIPACENLIFKISQENKKLFGVFGNHDHQAGISIQELEENFEKNGINILINESKEIKLENNSFYLVGVDDPHLEYDNLKLSLEDVEKEKFKILLSHSPEIFIENKKLIQDNKINLVLAGHTHGGQINIPFLTNFFISWWLDGKYTAGPFEEERIFIYVNRGLGTYSLFPFRFNCPPEVTLISIKIK